VKRLGSVGRNAIFDMGLWNLDLATTRRFFLTEEIEAKLEAQMLNAFNHTNLSGIQTNIVNSNFGRYQSTRGTRIIQMNFLLTF
jgi:phospholipase/lecithinase/hemolysin